MYSIYTYSVASCLLASCIGQCPQNGSITLLASETQPLGRRCRQLSKRVDLITYGVACRSESCRESHKRLVIRPLHLDESPLLLCSSGETVALQEVCGDLADSTGCIFEYIRQLHLPLPRLSIRSSRVHRNRPVVACESIVHVRDHINIV